MVLHFWDKTGYNDCEEFAEIKQRKYLWTDDGLKRYLRKAWKPVSPGPLLDPDCAVSGSGGGASVRACGVLLPFRWPLQGSTWLLLCLLSTPLPRVPSSNRYAQIWCLLDATCCIPCPQVDKIIARGDTADTDTWILQFLEVTDCKDPSVHILCKSRRNISS